MAVADGGVMTSSVLSPSRSPHRSTVKTHSPRSWRRALSFSNASHSLSSVQNERSEHIGMDRLECGGVASPSSAITLNTEELLRKYDCGEEEASSCMLVDCSAGTALGNSLDAFNLDVTKRDTDTRAWLATQEEVESGQGATHDGKTDDAMTEGRTTQKEHGRYDECTTSLSSDVEVFCPLHDLTRRHVANPLRRRHRVIKLAGSTLASAVGFIRRTMPSPEAGGALLTGAALAIVALRTVKVGALDRRSEIHFTLDRSIGEKLFGAAKVTVKENDTMWGLWQRHKDHVKDLGDLMECNQHISDPDLLPIAVELRLPRRGLAKRLLGDGCIRDAQAHSVHEEKRRELSRISREWSKKFAHS